MPVSVNQMIKLYPETKATKICMGDKELPISNIVNAMYSSLCNYYYLEITENGSTIRLRISNGSVKVEAIKNTGARRWFEYVLDGKRTICCYYEQDKEKNMAKGIYVCGDDRLSILWHPNTGTKEIELTSFTNDGETEAKVSFGKVKIKDIEISSKDLKYYQSAVYHHRRVQELINFVLGRFEKQIPGLTSLVKTILSDGKRKTSSISEVEQRVEKIFSEGKIALDSCNIPYKNKRVKGKCHFG